MIAVAENRDKNLIDKNFVIQLHGRVAAREGKVRQGPPSFRTHSRTLTWGKSYCQHTLVEVCFRLCSRHISNCKWRQRECNHTLIKCLCALDCLLTSSILIERHCSLRNFHSMQTESKLTWTLSRRKFNMASTSSHDLQFSSSITEAQETS